MFGVLVCEPGGVVLRAFSGQLALSADSDGSGGGGWLCPGWAGPVAGLTNASAEYGRYRRVTEALTRRIDSARARRRESAPDEQQQQQQQEAALARLRARRRALSHALIARVQDSYATRDALGRPLRLREAYLALAAREQEEAAGGGGRGDGGAAERAAGGASAPLAPPPITRLSVGGGCGAGGSREEWLGFPSGVGDCCAPKLLHEAAMRGLRPVALCEFWFGAPPEGDERGSGQSNGSGGETGDDDDEEEEEEASGVPESKEAAWRRRQRQRVLKIKKQRAGGQGAGSKASAANTAATTISAAEPTGARRQHGLFYGPCPKCEAILGTMLCTAPS